MKTPILAFLQWFRPDVIVGIARLVAAFVKLLCELKQLLADPNDSLLSLSDLEALSPSLAKSIKSVVTGEDSANE